MKVTVKIFVIIIIYVSCWCYKMNDTQKRTLTVLDRLYNYLYFNTMPNLQEFTKGGISVCCVILKIENIITGKTFNGEIN